MNQMDPNAEAGDSLSLDQELDVETVAALAQEETRDDTCGHASTDAAQAALVPIPRPPLQIAKQPVSGRYRGRLDPWELDLRVDVDGVRPLRRVSGDYYHVSGATTSYFGSFIVHALSLVVTAAEVVIEGTAQLIWQTSFTVAQVRIPRRTILQPQAPAVVQWKTPGGQLGAKYPCPFVTRAFRTVDLEQDCEAGVTLFATYDTGALPSGGTALAESREAAGELACAEAVKKDMVDLARSKQEPARLIAELAA